MGWTFTFQTELNPVTIYAAVVATAVAAWQVFTYLRDGPRLDFRVGTNMRLLRDGSTTGSNYISFNVTNIGKSATTITNMAYFAYDNRWQRLRRRPSWTAIANPALNSTQVPQVLEPGRTFKGLSPQTARLVELSKTKLFYAVICQSMKPTEVHVRIKPI